MRLPEDPYMHIWLQSWHDLCTESQWPPVYNQIGCRGFTLLVDDLHQELARIHRDFSETVEILQEPVTIRRKWGPTHTALLRDPEGNFLELMTVDGNPQERVAKRVPNHAKGFLHFMVNCYKFAEMREFYSSFGMEHDHGVDIRKDGWPDGADYFQQQYVQGFGAWPNGARVTSCAERGTQATCTLSCLRLKKVGLRLALPSR